MTYKLTLTEEQYMHIAKCVETRVRVQGRAKVQHRQRADCRQDAHDARGTGYDEENGTDERRDIKKEKMEIGNGFFTETIEDAVEEMKKRKGCEVERVPYPTIGNITYYLSENGDLFGVQRVATRFITREKTPTKYKIGYSVRFSKAPHKEEWVQLNLAMYNTFIAKEWTQTELEYKNGNVYDVRPENIKVKNEEVPPEYAERMNQLADLYKREFRHVCDYCCFWTGIPFEDARDCAQNAFMYLTTNGWTPAIYMNQDFVGLWKKIAKLRSYDFLYGKWKHDSDFDFDRYEGSIENGFEFDLIERLPGEKQKLYLRLTMQGETPTEVAKMTNSKLCNVSSSNTRAIQFLRRYLRNERQFR